MASATTMELIAVRKYESFEDIKTLVDVGGGVGKDLETIISSYPHIHGINNDLSHVIADAPTMPGIRDFFHAKPLWYLQHITFVGSANVIRNGQSPAHYIG